MYTLNLLIDLGSIEKMYKSFGCAYNVEFSFLPDEKEKHSTGFVSRCTTTRWNSYFNTSPSIISHSHSHSHEELENPQKEREREKE